MAAASLHGVESALCWVDEHGAVFAEAVHLSEQHVARSEEQQAAQLFSWALAQYLLSSASTAQQVSSAAKQVAV